MEKYLKLFSKNWQKNWSILKHFWLKKYLKVVFSTESVWKMMIFENEKITKIKNGSNKKIVFSRPLEKYVLDKKNYIWDTDFVETKFFYKNHVLELNFKIKNMSKKWPQKPKKRTLNHIRAVHFSISLFRSLLMNSSGDFWNPKNVILNKSLKPQKWLYLKFHEE